MPSGVTQFSAATSPPGADLAAAFFQRSKFGAVFMSRIGSLITSQSSQNHAAKTTAKLENRANSGLLICEACEDDEDLHGRPAQDVSGAAATDAGRTGGVAEDL